jgi:two-component system response regulator RegA
MPTETPRSALIWDDDVVDREHRLEQFHGAGIRARAVSDDHQVLAAVSGPDAPELLIVEPWSQNQFRFDVVERVHRLRPELRIVIVSSYASLSVACESIRRGARACLNKPASILQILAALRSDISTALPSKMLSLARVEWEYVQWVLLSCRGNKSEAARHLGLHRSTLQRKLAKYPPAHP